MPETVHSFLLQQKYFIVGPSSHIQAEKTQCKFNYESTSLKLICFDYLNQIKTDYRTIFNCFRPTTTSNTRIIQAIFTLLINYYYYVTTRIHNLHF